MIGICIFILKSTFKNNVHTCFFRFILIDLGAVGRHSDGGIFSNSAFGQSLEDGTLVLPNPAPLPNATQQAAPYVIVGDEAFPLRNYLMRPYPG